MRAPHITSAAVSVPISEKSATNEKSVPDIRLIPITFTMASRMYQGKGRISTASKIGRFAIPSLMKGKGFGSIYSIEERKKQKAPKSAVTSAVSVKRLCVDSSVPGKIFEDICTLVCAVLCVLER